MPEDRVLVYSTDGSLPLPSAKRAGAPKKQASSLPDDGVVRVLREKRRSSAMTLVHGAPAAQIDELGKTLRRACGTGGTTKNGVIELQGDHRDTAIAFFEARGLRVKKAGG